MIEILILSIFWEPEKSNWLPLIENVPTKTFEFFFQIPSKKIQLEKIGDWRF